jgi:nitroreductase
MKYNLSEVTELIRNRRSIAPEHFGSRKVHREQVELMLNNASWAPNHGLTQPWRFVVMNDQSKIELAEVAFFCATNGKDPNDINLNKVQRMKDRILTSSVVIALNMHRDPAQKVPEWEEVAAMGAAVQNLHLTATAYGLAGFWATPSVIQHPAMRDFLQLSEGVTCLGFFYLGYLKEDGEFKSHRKPLEYVTTWRMADEG